MKNQKHVDKRKTGLHYKVIIFFHREYKLWLSNRHRVMAGFSRYSKQHSWKYMFQQFKKQKSQSSHSFRAKILNLQLKFLAFLSHWKSRRSVCLKSGRRPRTQILIIESFTVDASGRKSCVQFRMFLTCISPVVWWQFFQMFHWTWDYGTSNQMTWLTNTKNHGESQEQVQVMFQSKIKIVALGSL